MDSESKSKSTKKKKKKKIKKTKPKSSNLVEEEKEIKFDNSSLNSNTVKERENRDPSVNPTVLNPGQIEILKEKNDKIETNLNLKEDVVLNLKENEKEKEKNNINNNKTPLNSEINSLIESDNRAEKKYVKIFNNNHNTIPEYDINNTNLILFFATLGIHNEDRKLMFQFNDISCMQYVQPFKIKKYGKTFKGCKITRPLSSLISIGIFLIIYNILLITMTTLIKLYWLFSLVIIIDLFSFLFISLKEISFTLILDLDDKELKIVEKRLIFPGKTRKVSLMGVIMFFSYLSHNSEKNWKNVYVNFNGLDKKLDGNNKGIKNNGDNSNFNNNTNKNEYSYLNNYVCIEMIGKEGIRREVLRMYIREKDQREEIKYLPGFMNHLLYEIEEEKEEI